MVSKKPIGTQGSWFAELDGQRFPCIHRHWVKGPAYHDPFTRHDGKNNQPRIREYADAIATLGQAILTDDIVERDRDGQVIGFKRSKYIAVYEVADVTYTVEDGLRFRMKRLYSL